MVKNERPWQDDGKRFVASLQDAHDSSCYKDFFESNTLIAAKEKAKESVEKYQRSVLIFDREQNDVVHKEMIEKKEPEKAVVSKKGRKKKPITKDDYF